MREEGERMTEFKEYIVRVDGFVPDAIYERSLEEVVRCRDCKHYEDYGGCCHRRYQPMAVTPDGFCAWGERRD